MSILKLWLKECILVWKAQFAKDNKFLSDLADEWPNEKLNLWRYHKKYRFFIRIFIFFFYWIPMITFIWPLFILAFTWNKTVRYITVPIEVMFTIILPFYLKPKKFWNYLGKIVFYLIYFVETVFGILILIKLFVNGLNRIILKWYKWRENTIEKMLLFQKNYINEEYLTYLQKKWSSDWDIAFIKKIGKYILNTWNFLIKVKNRTKFWLAARKIYIKFRFRTRKIRRNLIIKKWIYRWKVVKLHILNLKWWVIQIKRKLILWYFHFSLGLFFIKLIIKAVVLTVLWPILPKRLFEKLAYRFLVIENDLHFRVLVKFLKFLKKRMSSKRYAKIIRFLSKTHIFGSYQPMPKGTRKFGKKQIKQ